MDLRNMLNNDVPANPAAASSPALRPPVQQPQPRRPAPPPLAAPHSPFPSPGPPTRPYGPPSQHSSPYSHHASPPASKAYPFPPTAAQFPQTLPGPPPHSPHSQHLHHQHQQHQQQQHQQQQGGYASSPGTPHITPHGTPHTPHPLSTHSTIHSNSAPMSTVTPSPHSQYPPPPIPGPPNQQHHYDRHSQQQQPISPLSHYPPNHHPQQHGYPRPSPVGSPVDGRPGMFAQGRGTPHNMERERERRDREERERDIIAQRQREQRERDISISPKTKVPYLPDRDEAHSPVPRKDHAYGVDSMPRGGVSRPNSQPQDRSQYIPTKQMRDQKVRESREQQNIREQQQQLKEHQHNQQREREQRELREQQMREQQREQHLREQQQQQQQLHEQRERERERMREREQREIREREREREREQREMRDRELHEQQQQREQQREQQQREQQQKQAPQISEYSRSPRPGQERQAIEGEGGAEKRKWNSPTPDRHTSKLNGSGLDRRDDASQAPQHSPGNNASQMSPPSTATAPSSNPKPASPPSPKSQQPPNNQQPLRPPPTPTQMVNTSDGQSGSPGSSGPPRKRPRGGEAPIWARKASRSSSSSPVMAARRQPPNSVHVAPQTQTPRPPQATSHPAAPPPTHPPASQQQPPIHQQARPAAPAVQPPNLRVPSVPHSWEPSIVNEKPYDEIIRRVADFLWSNVILRDDPALANTGPDAPVIEIEAKLGHIIDKTTNDRLRLPIASEAVLSNEDGLRMQFRSSMTEPQHRRANDFLNNVLQKSAQKIPDAPPRVPLTYRHIREVDSFYELPADQVGSLPEIVRQNHNPRMQMRVRVTRDQKTQEVVRKLIKTRVADLNIHYPSASFDVRISINIETPYTGDIEGLVAITGTPGSGDGSRSKDRLSYSHLAYHVDLTQVTDKFGKKEHELEVEVNGTELRRQGLRARDGERNHFEKMVEGFVDNVRVLTRHLSP